MEITHDESASKFFVVIDGAEAHLVYRRVDADTVDFVHTFVPPEHRGRGIAEALVRHAFAFARTHGLHVIPSCWYVRRLAERDPELGALTT